MSLLSEPLFRPEVCLRPLRAWSEIPEPSALPAPEQSPSAAPGRGWWGPLPSPPTPGSQEAATFAPRGLGSPSLCQQLPSTWGEALPCCPLGTPAAHSPAGTQSPIPSERSVPVPQARSGASHVEETPEPPGLTPAAPPPLVLVSGPPTRRGGRAPHCAHQLL